MSNNLDEKIRLLLQDLKSLPDYEAKKMLQNFIKLELNFLYAYHLIYNIELNMIQSCSTRKFIDTSIEKTKLSPSEFRIWCLVDSVVGFLNSKGLTNFSLKLKE